MSDIDWAAKAAMDNFDREAFADLLCALIDIPSPTGDEAEIARFAESWLSSRGVEAHVQAIDERQANTLARLPGYGHDGADLLIYAPLDTHLAALVEEDVPGACETIPPIWQPRAVRNGSEIAGLGAENPKAFVAAAMMTTVLLREYSDLLRGDLMLGLGAGGMPTNKRPGNNRAGVGHGAGVAHMLEQGFRADYAVIAKPVWQVSYEEAGLAWFRIRVRGLYGYSGLRHLVPYRNPVRYAARVVEHIEAWIPQYSSEHEFGAVRPQGVVSAITGGWPWRPAFVPANCDVYVDMRVAPNEDPVDVKRALLQHLNVLRATDPEIELDVEMILAIPGSRTDPDNWIVKTCIQAWEEIEGRPHEQLTNYSGSTDANVLRLWGVPTARIGVPQRAGEDTWAGHDPLPMNLVDIDDCAQLVALLIRVALMTCSEPIAQTRGGGGR